MSDCSSGPITPTVAYTTVKFREANPKTYKAFFDAFTEATTRATMIAWVVVRK